MADSNRCQGYGHVGENQEFSTSLNILIADKDKDNNNLFYVD